VVAKTWYIGMHTFLIVQYIGFGQNLKCHSAGNVSYRMTKAKYKNSH
jgi:hypothetical protein